MLLHTVLMLLGVLNNFGDCQLWPKGVVHYTINAKDYDLHSQDEITSTLTQIERELCVKFFSTPDRGSYNGSAEKILYISNPKKIKDCPPEHYDYGRQVVDMPIGYKCLNQKEISRIVVDMLRASVKQTDSLVNSFDLIRRFQDVLDDPSRPSLLTPTDRNYLNAAYAHECALLTSRPGLHASYKKSYRRGGDSDDKLEEQEAEQMTAENHQFYDQRLWPLGVVMYGVQESLKDTPDHAALQRAITSIELESCLVFQELAADGVLAARSALWFAEEGASEPALGTTLGNQTLSLSAVVHGAPGHTAHTLALLLRAVGVPMASNRPDRDNYVTVNWKNVEKGKEHLLERVPAAGWLRQLAYDFESAAHAPANYACGAPCRLGGATVQPTQDQLWQRTLKMGHTTELSALDVKVLQILYGAQCQQRFVPAP